MARLHEGRYVDDIPAQSPTRAQYLNGECTHREFYGAVVKDAGIRYTPEDFIVQRAMESKDGHYNDIPLTAWDAEAAVARPAISRALKAHGDFWSLAGGLCVVKEAVRQVIERTQRGK